MLFNIKSTARFVTLLLPLAISACNGGGGDSSNSATVIPGNLVVTSASSYNNTEVVLGGTHKYVVTLANSENLSEPVVVTVNSSNNQVAAIQSNTCATTGVSATQSCSFYINGASAGSATITVSANNYQSVVNLLNVSQQWGTFSSEVSENGLQLSASQLTFGGDYVYAYTSGYVVKSNGGSWQIVGDGSVTEGSFSEFPRMASDDTHVCVSLDSFNGQNIASKVRCSTDGSAWQTSAILDGWITDAITLYQDRIYILVSDIGSNRAVMYCSIDNCSNWQQQGQIFPYTSSVNDGTFFQSTAYIQNSTGVYYQADDGSWQLYGAYTVSSTSEAGFIAAGLNGVALMPIVISDSGTYLQQVYFNNPSNLGGAFSAIGGGISVTDFAGYGNNLLAMNNNELFAAPGDDNIYLSTNIGSVWSLWSKVGQNNPPLTSVYVINNKVYSIYLYDANVGSQIYVYSLN